MRKGFKHVRQRRDDALAGVKWDQLEHLLADYYRSNGYAVEHVGTGASSSRFDGGIDLRLLRDGSVVLVQVKHWNAYQVPHNEVHQLIGLMVNSHADGAILVTSGEFTRAAIEAAARNGLVELIDGNQLRAMLGPLPDPPPSAEPNPDGFSAEAGERLLREAIDTVLPLGRKAARDWARFNAAMMVVKGVAFLVLLVIGYQTFRTISRALGSFSPGPAVSTPAAQRSRQPAATPVASEAAMSANACSATDPQTGRLIDICAGQPVQRPPTQAEIRESQRKADEAIEILRDSTPEM